MIILSEAAGAAQPADPWAALGIAAGSLGLACGLILFIKRAFDRDPRNANKRNARPPWWRIRVLGYWDMTAVPLVFFSLFVSLSMASYSLFVWTGWNVAVASCAMAGISAVGCFFWGAYDSYGPHAWKRNRRDEYNLY